MPLLGSVARGESDDWSDIDVAIQVVDAAVVEDVAKAWTSWLKGVVGVADTLDVHASRALYRVFLLDSSMQVDLSFWPPETLRSTGEAIQVMFGRLPSSAVPSAPDPAHHIRTGWLYALHARAAIARGRSWQGDAMLTSLREQSMTLTCIRLGLDATHGRQAHRVPDAVSAPLVAARAGSMGVREQQRSLATLLGLFGDEVALHDAALALALSRALLAMRPQPHGPVP